MGVRLSRSAEPYPSRSPSPSLNASPSRSLEPERGPDPNPSPDASTKPDANLAAVEAVDAVVRYDEGTHAHVGEAERDRGVAGRAREHVAHLVRFRIRVRVRARVRVRVRVTEHSAHNQRSDQQVVPPLAAQLRLGRHALGLDTVRADELEAHLVRVRVRTGVSVRVTVRASARG